jgi:hypothetical protein
MPPGKNQTFHRLLAGGEKEIIQIIGQVPVIPWVKPIKSVCKIFDQLRSTHFGADKTLRPQQLIRPNVDRHDDGILRNDSPSPGIQKVLGCQNDRKNVLPITCRKNRLWIPLRVQIKQRYRNAIQRLRLATQNLTDAGCTIFQRQQENIANIPFLFLLRSHGLPPSSDSSTDRQRYAPTGCPIAGVIHLIPSIDHTTTIFSFVLQTTMQPNLRLLHLA